MRYITFKEYRQYHQAIMPCSCVLSIDCVSHRASHIDHACKRHRQGREDEIIYLSLLSNKQLIDFCSTAIAIYRLGLGKGRLPV